MRLTYGYLDTRFCFYLSGRVPVVGADHLHRRHRLCSVRLFYPFSALFNLIRLFQVARGEVMNWSQYYRDLPIPNHWIDVSYSNDVYPSFQTSESEDHGYIVFIDSYDVEVRIFRF